MNSPASPLLREPLGSSHGSRKDHLTFKANIDRGRHGWLRLTPAYSVHLVQELVARHTRQDFILDPFCGTGTTVLACVQSQIRCHTVDINPFLVRLAAIKYASYAMSDIQAARRVLDEALLAIESTGAMAWTPPIKDIEKWWDQETLTALSHVFQVIRFASVSEPARDLLYVIFSRVSIGLASVSFGHQSMSFKKAKPREILLFEEDLRDVLRSALRRAGAEIFQAAAEPTVSDLGRSFLGDSRCLPAVVPATEYTAVVTSPPYPNRMSYIRELRPYMYWLGYLSTGRDAGDLDWQAIGGTWGCATSNLMAWKPESGACVPHDGFAETVERITSRSRVLGAYVNKYFHDTVQHIGSLKEVLAGGALAQYVVGNSKFYDVVLDTEEIYASIFRATGFRRVTVTPIRKRTSKKELFEYIVSATR